MIKTKICCILIPIFFLVIFEASATAGNDSFFEFSNFPGNAYRLEGKTGGYGPGNNQCSYITATKLDIIPEECRFYLNYSGSGNNNVELLTEAENVKNALVQSIGVVDKENIIVEMASYNPEQYLGSFLKSQKEEIDLQYRIIVKLGQNFWENAKKIAKVLDAINNVKKNQKLGMNLNQGEVRYAVKQVEPFVRDMIKKTDEKIKMLKENVLQINQSDEKDMFFKVTYDEIRVEQQTLEKVTLVLPYTFSYELKKELHPAK